MEPDRVAAVRRDAAGIGPARSLGSEDYTCYCMCMSLMERRLQLLLDQARYDRVSEEAIASGRSVAAVIRDAIDQAYPSGDNERGRALTEFLARSAEPTAGPGESWTEIKAQLADALDEELSR